jgi:hypothetical protein
MRRVEGEANVDDDRFRFVLSDECARKGTGLTMVHQQNKVHGIVAEIDKDRLSIAVPLPVSASVRVLCSYSNLSFSLSR